MCIRDSSYKDSDGHGRVDLPHVVIMIGYAFGKGWSMGSEIEFEPVSYTHLLNGSKQRIQFFVIHIHRIQRIDTTYKIPQNIPVVGESIIPVSYTHLDVYKRQV